MYAMPILYRQVCTGAKSEHQSKLAARKVSMRATFLFDLNLACLELEIPAF
jgi:hypothetical protein